MATLLVGPGRPYTTIQAAINVVSATNDNPASRAAMDIILVDPGTYTEALDLRASWLLPVIIRGADPANRPIIASTGAAQAVRADSVYRGTAVGELTLEDLIFSGWTNASNGVVYITTSGLVVRRAKFTGCTNRIPIRTVRGSATRYGLVQSCEFDTSGATTGLILGDSAYTDVFNCKAICPTNVPFYSDLGGATRYVFHNAILGTWNTGNTDIITVTGGTARGNLAQNLGTGARYGIYEFGAGNYNENIFFGAFTTRFFGTDGGGNQNADPLFVNTGTGDLRLQVTSPAVGSLSRSPEVLLDILGVSRSDPTDAGAYQMTFGTTVSTVTMPSSTTVRLTLMTLVANDATWTTTGNFTITPPGGASAVSISAAAVTDAGMSITLTVSEHLQGGAYNVAWAGLTNVTNGNMAYAGVGVAPTLTSLAISTRRQCLINFSEGMTNNAALTTTGNYTLLDVTAGSVPQVISSVTRISATQVRIVLDNAYEFIGGRVYRASATTITDLAGNTISNATADDTAQWIPLTATCTYLYGTYQQVAISFGDYLVDPTVSAVDLAATYVFTKRPTELSGSGVPSVLSVTVPNPSNTVTIVVQGASLGQNYRCAMAGTDASTAANLDFVGVDTVRSVDVNGPLPVGNWGAE